MRFTIHTLLCFMLGVGSLAASVPTATLMPTNDDVCDAIAITLDEDCSAGPNIDLAEATAETGEPLVACAGNGEDTVAYNSVWYTFIAPAEEVYFLATPENPTLRLTFQMSIYSVSGDCSDFANFTEVECSNPMQPFIVAPSIQTTLTEGETYYIRVSGRTFLTDPPSDPFSDTGCLTVRLVSEITAPNDDICDAIALEVDSAAVTGNNLNATDQTGELAISPAPDFTSPLAVSNNGWAPGTNFLDNSVWYTFTTGSVVGNYNVDLTQSLLLAGNFNTQVAVYAADDCNDFSSLTQVAAGDNAFGAPGNPLSTHTNLELFCLPASTTYYVVVDGGASFFFQPILNRGFFNIQVTNPEAQPISLSSSRVIAPSCPGESDGTIAVAFQGGTGTYTYAWSTGADTPSLVGTLAAGDYTLTVTDQCGFEVVETFTVEDELGGTLTASPLVVCEEEFTQLQANVSGGRLIETERLFTQGATSQDGFTLRSGWLRFPEQSTAIRDTQRVQMREMEFVGDDLYGATSDAKLYSIDAATGEEVLIDSMAVNGVYDLSYAPATGKTYVVDADFILYELTPATATVTPLYTLPKQIFSSAVDTAGLAIIGFAGDSLFTIELATGTVTSGILASDPPFVFAVGLENDPATDQLYLSTPVSIAPGAGGVNWQRYTVIDKETGGQTSVAENFVQQFRTGAFALRPGTPAAYTYAWTPADGTLNDPTSPTPNFTGTETTTYTVTTTDGCGNTATGMVTVEVTAEDAFNDNVCDATPLLFGCDCSDGPNIDLTNATSELGEPLVTCAGNGEDTVAYNSVWYTFVAPAEEVYFLAAPENPTLRLTFQMSIYSVSGDCSDFANFTEVECSNPMQPFITAPSVQTTLTEGETYYIRVSGRTFLSDPPSDPFSDTGCLTVRLVSEITAPNDDICDAIALEVDSAAVTGNNLNATAQDGEFAISPSPDFSSPLALGNSGWALGTNFLDNSVWYTFTTGPEVGNYNVDLTQSLLLAGNFNTQVAVYSAGDCNDFSSLTLVGAGDNGFGAPGDPLSAHTNLELFCLPPNTTYYVVVDGGASFLFQPILNRGFFNIQVTNPEAQPIILSNSLVLAPSCAGESDGTIVAAFQGGTGTYTYSWSTGATTQDLIGSLAAGDYTLTITDQCGFEAVETFTLQATSAAELSADPMGPGLVVCEGEEVQLSANVSGGRPVESERLFAQGFTAPGALTLRSSWLRYPENGTIIRDTQRVQMREMEFIGEEMYGVTSDAKFYQIDKATGAETFIDSLLIDGVIDLSYAAGTDKLYVTDRANQLYEVTPATGAVTSLYTLPRSLFLSAIDTAGVSIIGFTFDSLFTIELATGTISSGIPVANPPFVFATGLENDPSTDQFYLSTPVTVSSGGPGANWTRYSVVNIQTGELESLGDNFAQEFRTGAFAISPGAAATFSYAWLPADGGLDDLTSGTPSLTASTTTTYTVVATDACGTMAEGMVTLTVAPTDSVAVDTVLTVGDAFAGITINGDTVIVQTLMSVNGCDSIVTTTIDAWPVATYESWPETSVRVSPNPTAGQLNLRTEGISERDVQVVIRDVFGRVLLKSPLRGTELSFDVSAFPAGQYYLELRSKAKLSVRRFVKI